MMKPNIQMNKRTIIFAGAVAVVGIIFFLFINPLWSKVSNVSQEVKVLIGELSSVRAMIKESKNFSGNRHPLSRGEVSVAINEIMELGASLNIDFFATSPQQIQKIQGSKYPVLPISMELQSTYENFGVFVGALENLSRSIVTVKQFNIERKPMLLPKIAVGLIVEIHLKVVEGG